MQNYNYTEDIKIGKIDRSNFDANIQFLEGTGLLKEGVRILEVGCGAGRMINYLTQRGFNVIGFDISRSLTKEGHIRYPDTMISIASGNYIPFKDSSFDIIISFDVIEHILDVNTHLSEVRRILKRDGFYLFQTPNKLTNIPFEVIKSRSLTKYKTYHCSLQTFWSLKRLLKKHDFELKFVKIPIENKFIKQKIENVFGRFGVYLLRLASLDRLPVPLKTNLYVVGKLKIKNKKITIFAPYDLNKINGNTIRPIMQAKGLFINNFNNFEIICLKTNPNLPFKQKAFKKGVLSNVPFFLQMQSISFLYNLPFRGIPCVEKTNIIHAHNFYSYFAIKEKEKIIFDLHTFKSNEVFNTYGNSLTSNVLKRILLKHFVSKLIKRYEKKICLNTDKIIVASENIAIIMAKEFNLPTDKFLTVNNMVEPGRYDINKHDKEFSIGVVGGFKDNINREVLFEIFKFVEKIPYQIYIIGSIYGKDAEKFSNYKNVKVLGKVEDEIYIRLLREISVLFAPYKTFRNGGGSRNKIIEAAICGTPIITTPAGAEGFDKDLLLLGNSFSEMLALIEICRDESFRLNLGKRLRTYALNNFQCSKETQKLIELYEKLG